MRQHGDRLELRVRLLAMVIMERSWLRPQGGRVAIAESAMSRILAFEQLPPAAREAGGILLGRLLAGSDDVVIDFMTGPSPADHRSRTSFLRAEWPTQGLVRCMWKRSSHTTNYLGEWHTHPAQAAEPSQFDLASWRRHTRAATCEQDFLFFLVVGLQQVSVWEHRNGWRRPIRLHEAYGG